MALPAIPTLGDALNKVGDATNALDPKNLIDPKTSHDSTVRDLVDWAGWNGDDIDTMTAICLAEGGSEIKADGTINCRRNFAGCCVGLFQINIDAWHISQEDACDYAKGAKFAHDTIFKAQGFKAWEAYTNGSYAKFKGQNKKIVVNKGVFGGGTSSEGPGGVSVPTPDVGGAIKGLVDLIQKIFDPSTWLRFGKIIFGTIILIIGFVMLFGSSNIGKTIAEVTPATKPVKATKAPWDIPVSYK